MLLLAAGLGVLGCMSPRSGSSSGGSTSRPNSAGGSAPSNNVRPFWARDDGDSGRTPPPANIRPTGGEATDYNGVVAGSLVDAFNRRVPRAYIQVASAEGNSKPIELAVENGYFVIPNLTPGKSYMLTARTVDGERKLAGRAQVTPPNARVVIRVSEDLYSGTVPPPPSDGQGTAAPRRDAPAAGLPNDGDGWRPDTPPAGRSGGNGGALRGDPPPPPLDAPPAEPDRIPPFNGENIAGGQDKNKEPRREAPPIINVPGGNPPAPPLPDPDPPPPGGRGPGAFRVPSGPAGAAFCDFAGPNRLKNFGLHDAYGQPWEFRQAQGRLVLLDFWGTWCMPCVKAIPHLKRLHAEYGPQGLEVIGIACERGAESGRQKRVLDAIEKYQINYRVLLGEEYEECPVQQKFRIQSYPTLILLDRNGTVLWRGDANGFAQLEAILKRDLRGTH
jgi:thiol-disulfide isomerase/thioredoxin